MKQKVWVPVVVGLLMMTLLPLIMLLGGAINSQENNDNDKVNKVTEPTGIFIEGFQQTDDGFYISLPNDVEEFNLSDSVKVSEGAQWIVTSDEKATFVFTDGKLPLSSGDNVFYICVYSGEEKTSYKVNLHRRWLFTVTFNSRGGSEINSQLVEEGSFAIKPDKPVMTGYNFDVWERDGSAYDFSQPVESNIDLVAKWKAKTFTVRYVTEIGSLEVSKEDVAYNSLFSPANPPENEQFEFSGWYIGKERISECVWKFEDDITLTAKWTSKTLEIENGIVTGFKADAKIPENLIIPKENGAETVTAIAPRAFAYQPTIASVVIPDTVEKIGEQAFFGCVSLSEITFGEKARLLECGRDAFGKTQWFGLQEDGLLYLARCVVAVKGIVSEVVIKSDTVSIADYVFEGRNIAKLTFNASLERIGNHAFEDVTFAFLEMVIPDSVTHIGDCAFFGSHGLASVKMISPQYLGGYAFFTDEEITVTVSGSVSVNWHVMWNSSNCIFIFV